MNAGSRRRYVSFLAAVGLIISACQQVPDSTSTTLDGATSVPAGATTMVATTITDAVVREGYALPDGFDLQGHRGARGLKPENTLPSFEAALDLIVTTLEFDLHLTADDEIVVWHDPVIAPQKCGLREGAPSTVPDPDDGSVSEDALAVRSLTVEQLSWYQCDRNPDPSRFPQQDDAPTRIAGDDYAIRTLDDLLDLVEEYASADVKSDQQRRAAEAVLFNMETKRKRHDPDAIADDFDGEIPGLFELRVLEVIARRGIEARTTIQSFDLRSLRAIHAVNDSVNLSYLESRPTEELQDLATWGMTEWSPNQDLVTAATVREAHDLGLAVRPWTIATVEQAERLLDAGVDGIITDRPDLFVVSE